MIANVRRRYAKWRLDRLLAAAGVPPHLRAVFSPSVTVTSEVFLDTKTFAEAVARHYSNPRRKRDD